MQKWHQIFQRNTGLNPYVWVVFYILPFYFVFGSYSTYQIVIGAILITLFFACYVLSFVSKGWFVYFWTSVQILVSITMTVLFAYVYFTLFLAYFIGNIQRFSGFITLYCIHLISTFATIYYGFVVSQNPVFVNQLPFIVVSLIAVILLPVTTYNRNKRVKLEDQLEDAYKRISELVKLEERQRIARDLHDTLGQKLSLIGLKCDLASRLLENDPNRAQVEINDVRQTARTALNEVRELVTQMRGTRLEDEILRIEQILQAAQIEFVLEGDFRLKNTSLLNENVLGMCLKEAITNVVKHSSSPTCTISIEPSLADLVIKVKDEGVGIAGESVLTQGNGLRGMKERLEFVNGSLGIESGYGTTIIMKVPNVLKQPELEADL